jgi:prepilin-type N-terminal cleavage/methylation domain-containing protein
MMNLKTIKAGSKGFTLVEIIVTILVTGILGAIFTNFIGTTMESSWNAVEITRDEASSEALMEEIIADYVEAINSNPVGALLTIKNKMTNGDYGGNVAWNYIEFDPTTGDEIDRGTNETDNLKVVLQLSGPAFPAITGRYPLTMILANSRREADDQIVTY